MKQLIRLTLNTLVAVGLMILVVGCNKSYKTVLGPEENITQSSSVEIDGRSDAGKVKRIYTDSRGQRVAEFTAGSEALRQGTIRVRGNDVIALRTENATAQALGAGAFIPVESSLTFVAKKWGTSALAILAVAAIAAVVCLRRFLAFQAAAPFVPLLVAVGLAVLTAYSAHGFVVPAIQELQTKIHPASPPATVQNGAQTMAAGGWNEKARSIENQVVEFLRTPADAARLLAFLAMFLITLPVYACLISWLFHKLRYQPAVCGLLLLAALPSALNAASVKREDVETSLSKVEALTLRAEELGADARRLDKAGLKDQAQVYAVRAYFSCDRAADIEEVPAKQIASISAWRASSETKATFQSRLLSSAQRRAGVEDALAEIAGAITNSLTRIYLIERANVKSRIRAGDTDEERLIGQLLALSRVPQSLVREHVVSLQNLDRLTFEAGKIRLPDGQLITLSDNKPSPEPKRQDDGKTAADLARLQNEQGELQAQVAELRRTQQNTNRTVPRTIIVTNTIVERLMPAPPPVVITNKERVFITNTIVATNPVLHATVGSSSLGSREGTNSAPTSTSSVASTKDSEQKSRSVSGSSDMTGNSKAANPANWILVAGKAALPWIGLICVFGLCAGIYSFLAAARTGTVQLAVDGKVLEPIEITSNEDAITLEAQPLVKAKADVADKAHLSATWLGTILRPGQQTVTINDLPAAKACRIKRGDTIRVQNGGAVLHQFDFLGWDRNSATAEA